MAHDDALYFVDVYVPNEGEPESALELAILQLNKLDEPPTVYVHTYLNPVNYSQHRIRWQEAAAFGINRQTITQQSWPTLHDIEVADYLRDKDIVCFCKNFEPVQSLIQASHYQISLLNNWNEVFSPMPEVASINHEADMLKYMGLPVEDQSNTQYTPLMKRMFKQIAIWLYLLKCAQLKVLPQAGDSAFSQNDFWPLHSVPDPWYTGQPELLSEIPTEALCQYFSPHLPDYIDWSNMFIYKHDWTFGRERSLNISLNEQDSMVNFIFNHLFNLKTRLLVLVFYSIYNNKTLYAQSIALNQGTFHTIPKAIKEDFSAFMIAHLDDFLSGQQKHKIISDLVSQVIRSKAQQRAENYDFEDYRRQDKTHSLIFIDERLDSNRALSCYQEIRSQDESLYRCFYIQGNDNERNECIDFINNKFRELLVDAKNPFASYWVSASLKQWIGFITGFDWQTLVSEPHHHDSETLVQTRQSLEEIFVRQRHLYFSSYKSNLQQCVDFINSTEEGTKEVFTFAFQAVTYKVVVDKTGKSSGFFSRLMNRF